MIGPEDHPGDPAPIPSRGVLPAPAGAVLHGEIVHGEIMPPPTNVISVRWTIKGGGFGPRPIGASIGWTVLFFLSTGALGGFSLGALLGAVQLARISSCLGAAILGSLVLLTSARLFRSGPYLHKSWVRRLSAILYAVFVAAAVGALAGATLVAFVGILAGAFAGGFLGALLGPRARNIGGGILLGSIVGPLILAFYVDRASALYWGLHGAWIGAAFGLLIVGLSWYALSTGRGSPRNRQPV